MTGAAMPSYDHIIKDVMKSVGGNAQRSFYDDFMGFYHAVDWTETWLRCLIGFHAALVVLVFVARAHFEIQCALFCLICSLVFLCEHLNSLGSKHWRDFANQDYFDRNGIFMGVVFAAPLLLTGFFQLLLLLSQISSLLVLAKKKEVKAKKKAREGTGRSAKEGNARGCDSGQKSVKAKRE
jgi:hypothetical protein